MNCISSIFLRFALCVSLTSTLYGCAVSAAGRSAAVAGCLPGARAVVQGYSGGGLECAR